MIGADKASLDTPILWVDLDAMESNIGKLAAFFRENGVSWRPHTKGIKVPAIAHKLLAAGAIGVTCAKLGEAEVMAAAGVRDILVANQVGGPQKVARLANLQRSASVKVAVDSLENAHEISDAAVAAGVTVPVLIELNTGMHRAGLEPGHPVIDFARQVAALPGIDMAGLMTWEGHCAGISDMAEKTTCVHDAVGKIIATADMLREAGVPVRIVSCGGSGTYMVTAKMKGVTEIQAGGAVFTDAAYMKWGVDLTPSLFVMARVTSRPTPTRALVDAGRKAMNCEATMPVVMNVPSCKLKATHAEHGLLDLEPGVPLAIGDKIDFMVGYGDNTVYLHDELYGIRRGVVEAVWDVQGRGKLR